LTAYLALIISTVSVNSCASSGKPDEAKSTDSTKATETITLENKYEKDFLQETNIHNFELELFKTAAKLNKNKSFVISPVSASFATSMAANICDSALQNRILNIVNFENIAQLNDYNRQLIDTLTKDCSGSGSEIYIGNALWLAKNKRAGLSDKIKTDLSHNFGAKIEYIDFSSANSLGEIKEWGKSITNGHMTPSLSNIDDYIFLLMNLFFYKGGWDNSFNEEDTKTDIFHKSDVDKKVLMMKRSDYMRYLKTDDYQAVSLNLCGNSSMTLILPDKKISTSKIISGLELSSINRIANESTSTEIQLSLPKYNISSQQSILRTLKGMEIDIKPDNFRNIGSSPRDSIVFDQLATITVNETGTAVYAETTISCILLGAYDDDTQPIVVSFDRPFLFLIRNNITNSIIIAGQYMGPE
ncbi:MAG: hypothetical protein K2I89_01120, partial [Muribaculaceae bacterium]|nr:hypothetical protein [Muribaculaceae bacterium]